MINVTSQWVDAYGTYLFNFAIGQVRDTHVAEDLVQDTFLAAHKSQACFSGRSSTRTWLVGILRHKIYDYLRLMRQERAVRVEPLPADDDGDTLNESLLLLHQVIDESSSSSRRLELGEFWQELEKALNNLPARTAQVFQLYYIEERSNREVCQQLNISERNLWVMLYRARRLLRIALATVI